MTGQTIVGARIARLIDSVRPCVLDLGARGGLDESVLPLAFATTAVCFEPDAAEARRLAFVGDSRWREFRVIPSAIGGKSSRAQLHVPAHRGSASLLPHNQAMVERFGRPELHVPVESLEVETWTLDDLQLKGEIGRADYIKIDVEGAELAILEAARSVLRDCVAMKVECSFLPQRVNQPLVWDVARWLVEEGFEVMDLDDLHRWRRRNIPSHPYRVRFPIPYSRGQAAQCDLVLLRGVDRLVDDAQALRLIVLSAALGYFDYAVSVIRARPEASHAAEREFGIDLELELGRWSAITGRHQVRQGIRSSIRGLVPLLRSFAGLLPHGADEATF